MDTREFADRLNERLDVDAFVDIDASPNGLQVGSDDGSVERVAFAVDAVNETAELAADWDADVLVTHHGFVWGGIERVTGRNYRRIATLIENDVALYVCHLPLDAHPVLGNAAGIADVLDDTDREPFGAYEGETVGVKGDIDSTTPERLAAVLEPALDTGPGDVRVLPFGPESVSTVGIVTGAGADYISEAAASDVDVLVTGEGKGRTYHDAKEAGVNVILGGHYATETFGVRSLQALCDDWGLETAFFDVPTGL